MIISSIEEGVVIDHIPAGHGMQLYHYLGLQALDCQIALIENASSNKITRKDMLKINSHIELNYDLLGYFDPNITVNIVHNGQITEKIHPTLPDRLTDILHCHNPRCITSTEQALAHIFRLTDPEKGIYRCIYCDTIGKPDER